MLNLHLQIYCKTRFLLTIFVLVLLPMAPSAAEDQSNAPLDVVLVMDSSGSMKWTDPRDLRKPAAKLFISLLGENDRAGVVSFSDQGYPVAFFTPVKGKQNEAKLFAAVDKISHKGVYTNLLGAVKGALRVINRDPLPGRKSIIVLMTDGKMDLGDSEKNQSSSDTLLNELIPQLQEQNIELHTIAFTGESDQVILEQLAQLTGGKFNLAQNDKQLHNVYTSIFEQNKQPNMLPFDGEKFTIDNAIKEVTIVGSKESETVQLSLLNPDGSRITAANKPANVKWFTAQAFDLITIQNPQPGQWRLQSSTGRNKAYVITDLKSQLRIEPREVGIGEGLMISAWLENEGETINKPSILSTLNMALRVHTPEGAIHDLDMQPQAKENTNDELSGVYMNHIALPSAGQYQIEVIAQGGTFSRVRNSLVKVFEPNSMPKEKPTHSSLPNIGPIMDPPLTVPASATQEPVEGHSQDKHGPPATPSNETHPLTAHDPEHQSDGQDMGEATPEQPAQAHKPGAAQPSKEHAEKQADKPMENAHKDKPNLVKALWIFLLLNAAFALLGGVVFLIYRMKKKKPANENPDESDADEGQEDKKRAA